MKISITDTNKAMNKKHNCPPNRFLQKYWKAFPQWNKGLLIVIDSGY